MWWETIRTYSKAWAAQSSSVTLQDAGDETEVSQSVNTFKFFERPQALVGRCKGSGGTRWLQDAHQNCTAMTSWTELADDFQRARTKRTAKISHGRHVVGIKEGLQDEADSSLTLSVMCSEDI